MLVQKNIRRISIPVEEFGNYWEFLRGDIESHLKRDRKRAFRDLARIIKLCRMVKAKEVILSIARGLTADGTATIEITVRIDHESKTT